MIIKFDAYALISIRSWCHSSQHRVDGVLVRDRSRPSNQTFNITVDENEIDESQLLAAVLHDGPIEIIITNLRGCDLHIYDSHIEQYDLNDDGTIYFHLLNRTFYEWSLLEYAEKEALKEPSLWRN